MHKTDETTLQEMKKAVTVYDGPVMQCPPGAAQAKPLRQRADEAGRWLWKHRHDPRDIADAKEKRRRSRPQRRRNRRRRERRSGWASTVRPAPHNIR